MAASSAKRTKKGTTTEQLYGWDDVEVQEISSALALQQYLQQLLRKDCSNIKGLVAAPPGHEEMCWVYEHIRQVCLELSRLVTIMNEVCTAAVCPKMIATNAFTFLCAAHKQANLECCAIDYITHTLDWAINQLNSEKVFKSRLDMKPADLKSFQNISRRIYRIFAHTYFHHRETFDQFEDETHLCERFVALCNRYDLVAKDAQLIPEIAFTKGS